MLKRILWLLLLALFLLAGWFFVTLWISYSKDDDPNKTFLMPRLQLSVFEVQELDAENITFNAGFLIHNRLPFGFKADSVSYRILIAGKEVSRSTYTKDIRVKASDSTLVSMPVTFRKEAFSLLVNDPNGTNPDSTEYEVLATFYAKLLFRKEFNIHIKKRLPLIKVPELEVVKLEVDSLRLSGAALVLHTRVKNSNPYDIEAKDIRYELELEDHDILEGSLPGHQIVPAKTVSEISFPLQISVKNTGKTLIGLLKKGGDLQYSFRLKLKIVSDVKSVSDSQVIMKSDGKVKTVVKFLKE